MNQNIFLKKNYSINFRTLDRMEKVFAFRKDYTLTMIFKLKTEESEKAKKKLEMRLI